MLHAITLSCLYVSRQNWELEGDGFSRQNGEAEAGEDHQLPQAEALTVPAQDERGKRDTDIRWSGIETIDIVKLTSFSIRIDFFIFSGMFSSLSVNINQSPLT